MGSKARCKRKGTKWPALNKEKQDSNFIDKEMQVKISLTSNWHIGFTYKIQCFIAYNSVYEDTGRKTFVTTTGGM